MIWPDFKFGSPTFNELTFDHWIVVTAELVPIDRICVAGPFIWEVRLSAPQTYQLDLAAPLAWQVNLMSEFKC